MERSEAITLLCEVATYVGNGSKFSDAKKIGAQMFEAIQTLSDANPPIRRQFAIRTDPKSRYDRYVCAVIASHPDPDMAVNEVAEWAIQLMLAADKRWSEYTKGGDDE